MTKYILYKMPYFINPKVALAIFCLIQLGKISKLYNTRVVIANNKTYELTKYCCSFCTRKIPTFVSCLNLTTLFINILFQYFAY